MDNTKGFKWREWGKGELWDIVFDHLLLLCSHKIRPLLLILGCVISLFLFQPCLPYPSSSFCLRSFSRPLMNIEIRGSEARWKERGVTCYYHLPLSSPLPSLPSLTPSIALFFCLRRTVNKQKERRYWRRAEHLLSEREENGAWEGSGNFLFSLPIERSPYNEGLYPEIETRIKLFLYFLSSLDTK